MVDSIPEQIQDIQSPAGDISHLTTPTSRSRSGYVGSNQPSQVGQIGGMGATLPLRTFPNLDVAKFEEGYDSDDFAGPLPLYDGVFDSLEDECESFMGDGMSLQLRLGSFMSNNERRVLNLPPGTNNNDDSTSDQDPASNRNERSILDPPSTINNDESATLDPALVSNDNDTSTLQPPTDIQPNEALYAMKTRDQLKSLFRERGLLVSGNKRDLIERLVQNNNPTTARNNPNMAYSLTTNNRTNQSNTTIPQGCEPPSYKDFQAGSYWEPLQLAENPVPSITGRHRPPTVPADQFNANIEAQPMYNVNAIIDRFPFSGQALQPKKDDLGRFITRSNKNGEQKFFYVKYPIKETIPNMDFINAHALTFNSLPVDWAEAFFPIGLTSAGKQTKFNLSLATQWTNVKKIIINSTMGGIYPDCKEFDLDYVIKIHGLAILNGLNPSPRIEKKFNPQSTDPVNGNDLVSTVFGPNAVLRFKQFKAFFAAQNPARSPPDTKEEPNYKIMPLLRHAILVSKQAMIIGPTFAVDEQTIGFQGQHKDKQRISYKKEGDGFLADALSSDGYTYSFYFRHQPPPTKYTPSFSPLGARVLALFDDLNEDRQGEKCRWRTCFYDNLYSSAKFSKAAYAKEIYTHGVCRLNRGFPSIVAQKEGKNKVEVLSKRNTLKAAVLKGDPECKGLLAVSIYDTVPVHMMTTATVMVKWIEKERDVYADTGDGQKANVKMKYHRLNIIDYYNQNMHDVDISDQLRTNYRIDRNMRFRKWWWSIYWWCFQMLISNSYVLYCKYYKMHGKTVPLDHYEYLEKIALAWLDPLNHRQPLTLQQEDNSISNSNHSSAYRSKRRLETDGETESSALSKKKRQRITDNTIQSKYRTRTTMSTVCFHPISSVQGKGCRCQLHYWALEKRYRKNLLYCNECDVALCHQCWNIWHSNHNLVHDKALVKAQLNG